MQFFFFRFLVYRELGTSFDFCLGLFFPWWHFPRVLFFIFFLVDYQGMGTLSLIILRFILIKVYNSGDLRFPLRFSALVFGNPQSRNTSAWIKDRPWSLAQHGTLTLCNFIVNDAFKQCIRISEIIRRLNCQTVVIFYLCGEGDLKIT